MIGKKLLFKLPQEEELPPDVEEWCTCGRCQQMPTTAQRICCQDHDVAHRLDDEGGMGCITDHPAIEQLTQPYVLESVYNGYLCYHGTKICYNYKPKC